jgi:hypothetical protein
MWPTLPRALFLFLGSAVILQVGCAAKKQITRDPTPFRMETLNNDSLLFAPPIPERHPEKESIQVTMAGAASGFSAKANCSEKQGPFSIEPGKPDSSTLLFTLPAPGRWLRDLEGRSQDDEVDDLDSLDVFLGKLDQLASQGCDAAGGASIRDFMLQSLPMRPNEGLFNAYGYRKQHSSVALKPGIRLKIERAYFRPAAVGEAEHDPKNFLGVSRLSFDVETTEKGETRFSRVGDVEYSPPTLAQEVHEGSADRGLSELRLEPYCRLLFYTFLVRKEHTISAAIIGASERGKLDQLEQELRKRADEPCKDFAATTGVACFEFDGFVTVSAQTSVEVNGATRFLDWGAKVRDILPKKSPDKATKRLKIQRKFMGVYHEIRFDPRDPKLLTLELVGGDRVSWQAKN